ncbi:hypothetical protein EON73_02550 [bacterium]|nr:MAG: hypothetical protein EON73_02550 [bacterium]
MFFCRTCCKTVNTESGAEEIPLPSTSNVNKSADVKQSNINFIKVLGKGLYGKVMLAETKDTKELYAVKVVRKDKIIKDIMLELANTEKNIMILTKKNPFFTTLHTYFQTPESLYFVLDFENGGDLLFHLQRSQRFDETRAAFYAAEIVLALQFLHRNKIIYRDLKLANVLLDRNGHCKLTDFGLSKVK